MDDETLEIIEHIIEWHGNQVGQLELIVEKSDADIKMEDMTIEAGTQLHRGIIIGVKIALMQLGELPFTLHEKS